MEIKWLGNWLGRSKILLTSLHSPKYWRGRAKIWFCGRRRCAPSGLGSAGPQLTLDQTLWSCYLCRQSQWSSRTYWNLLREFHPGWHVCAWYLCLYGGPTRGTFSLLSNWQICSRELGARWLGRRSARAWRSQVDSSFAFQKKSPLLWGQTCPKVLRYGPSMNLWRVFCWCGSIRKIGLQPHDPSARPQVPLPAPRSKPWASYHHTQLRSVRDSARWSKRRIGSQASISNESFASTQGVVHLLRVLPCRGSGSHRHQSYQSASNLLRLSVIWSTQTGWNAPSNKKEAACDSNPGWRVVGSPSSWSVPSPCFLLDYYFDLSPLNSVRIVD